MDKIDAFKGKHGFLSNFYTSPFVFNGSAWRTVEHAFQACKTTNTKSLDAIKNALSPGEAKRLGRAAPLRKDWEHIKVRVMAQLLFTKFSSSWALADQLLSTGDTYLEEGNIWHDNIWGNCPCTKCKTKIGENHLGRLLMIVRQSLKVSFQ